MTLAEDLSVFLADFGVSCTAGAVTAQGILDMPMEVLAGDQVLSTDYTLTARASDFGDLQYGAEISVNGVPYTVRETRLIDDGAFCQIGLMRSVATSLAEPDTPIDGGDVDDVITDLGNEQLNPEFDGGSASSSYLEGNDLDGGAA
jgi:hypothetical protein